MGGIFKGKKGVSTTTQTTSAPAYLNPQLEFSASEARRLYDQGPQQFFPGQTYVSYSDPTRQGIDLLGQAVSPEEENSLRRFYNESSSGNLSSEEMAATQSLYDQARGGLSSTSLAAQNQLQKTLQGDYLGITPELQNYMDVIARRSEQSYNENVLPSLRSGYGRSGAFGGSDFQQGLQTSGRNFTRELADNLSGVALRNYQGERANQQNALGLAPTYEELAYSPALMAQQAGSALSGIKQRNLENAMMAGSGLSGINQRRAQGLLSQGQMLEEEKRMALQEQMDRFNFNQNAPQERLSQFNSNLQGSYIPGTNVVSTATPYKKGSTFGKLMGGALTLGGAFMGGSAGAQGGQQLGSLFGGEDSTAQQAYSPGGLVNYNYTQPQASSGSSWGSLFGGGGQKAPASMGSWYGSRGFLG